MFLKNIYKSLLVALIVSWCWAVKDIGNLLWGKILTGHDFRFLPGLTLDDCYKECKSRSVCISFNYCSNRKWCTLNNASLYQIPDEAELYPAFISTARNDWVKAVETNVCDQCKDYEKCNETNTGQPCSIQECKPATPTGDSKLLGTSTAVGSKVKHMCYTADGKLIASYVSHCLTDGSWSKNDTFTCSVKHSCYDIYKMRPDSSSGLYSVPINVNSIEIFCDFNNGGGYTYLSKSAFSILSDLSQFHNRQDHAMVRILYSDSSQKEVKLEQLSSFTSYPLSFQFSQSAGYTNPVNRNLGPYIFLGFVPVEAFSGFSDTAKPTQGYRAEGGDYTFGNCDGNYNSYLIFLNDLSDKKEINKDFMKKWIDSAQLVPSSRNLPDEFFYQFEMHMGGCGGYLTSKHVVSDGVTGVALGFPFEL